MTRCSISLLIAAVAFSSCAPQPHALDDFKKSTLAQSKDGFQRLYKTPLDEASVKVMTTADLDKWIAVSPYKNGGLPCEINEVIHIAKGNSDPSPIALDVTGSSPEKRSLVYVPIPATVNCPSPRSGFFVDSKDCGDKSVLVCNGKAGADPLEHCPTCQCKLVCDATATNCPTCD